MDECTQVQTRLGPLSVHVRGDGPPAVLWHSLFVDERSWQRVEEALARDRRLVIITGPGHGASPDPGRRYSVDDCAAAVVDVLAALGIAEPVDWVGNAWGGHVGVIAAARYPERIRSLVTAGSPVQGYTMSGRIQTGLLLIIYRLFGPRRFLVDSVIEALLSERTRSSDDDAVAITRDGFLRAGGLANAVVSISLRRPDLTPLLPKVTTPTLFITGTEHSDWSPDQATTASQLLPDGSVRVIEGSAYLSPLETPDEFARLVREHWATHNQRQGEVS